MLKDRLYTYFVRRNEKVRYEYERYVIENIDEHKKKRIKHLFILFKLNWHYCVRKKNDKYIYKEKYIEKGIESDYDLIKNSVYFDEKWYKNNYSDVSKSGMNPIEHYLYVGWKEFRRPGPSFSTLLYINRYDDVNEMGINPLLHYEKIGKKEKRVSSYEGLLKTISKEITLIENSKFFDGEWYKETYLKNDVTKEKPSVHYFCIGCYLGMNPSSAFSNALYRQYYPEVKNIPYLLHYETYSRQSGKGYLGLSTTHYNNKNKELDTIKEILNVTNIMMEESNYGKKKVLLISHLLNLTGAPRVLFSMAKILQEKGFFTVILSIGDGPLKNEIEKENIPTVIAVNYENEEKIEALYNMANYFDFMVFSTIESMKFAHILKHTRAYKIAWVHEGNETLKLISEHQKLRINLMDEVYSGSHYCNHYFERYLNNGKQINTLYYGVEQNDVNMIANNSENLKRSMKKTFVIAGSIGYRKGYHILSNAYKILSLDDRDKIEIWIIGAVLDREVGNEIENLAKENNNIKILGEVPNAKLIEYIKSADLLVCPSIDDPLPVVVTDALILKKPVIVTDMVGTSFFIENEINGFVVKSGDANALAELISRICNDEYDLEKIGENGKRIFDENLSYERFIKNIEQIFAYKKIRNNYKLNRHLISNKVFLCDIELNYEGYLFIFRCDLDNELIMLCNDVIYHTINLKEQQWICLNEYLSRQNEKVVGVLVKEVNLVGKKVAVASNKFDSIELHVNEYSWMALNELAQKDICLLINENIISFFDRELFYDKVTNGKISVEDKNILYNLKNNIKFTNNIYIETRNNKNDNAYQLFLYDLKTNKNAYFLTTDEVMENETNEYIKKHMSRINSNEAKKLMLEAKNIIVSWYATPIFGETRMKLFYPFMNLNYILVPHGISCDKDSYYLNYANWGKFREIICCSDYEKDYFMKYNGHKNVKVLGYPRLDKWANSQMDENMLLIFPSWRDEISETYVNNICDLCRFINSSFKEKQIIYIAHPSIEKGDYLNIESRLKNISINIYTIMAEETEKFNKYFSEAKYLITDYSSVAYDFAYKGGIAIYYEKFIDEEVHYHMNSLFYKVNCGYLCKSTDEIGKLLKSSNVNENRNKFFKYIDGQNTYRVYEEIKRKKDE